VKHALGADWEFTLSLFTAFPELAHRAFYIRDGEIEEEQKIFGKYYVKDVPTVPRPPSH
jgi:hypothetical protein